MSLKGMEMFIHYWHGHQRTDDTGHHYLAASWEMKKQGWGQVQPMAQAVRLLLADSVQYL